MPRKIQGTEHQHQAAFIQWCAIQAMKDARYENVFAIPNGGHRHAAVAGKLKAEGVKRGVPDIFIAWASEVWGKFGLFIEMKRGDGRITPEQYDWHTRLRNGGYGAVVCYSVDEAIKVTKDYFREARPCD